MDKKANGAISVYRFIFAIIVALHHFFDHLGTTYVCGGYMAVSFFFILSGFLLAKTTETQTETAPEDAAWKYLKKRFLILWPQYCLSLIVCVWVKAVYLNVQQVEPMPILLETALLHGVVDSGGNFNHATWFLSALIWCEFILVYLLKKNRECCLKIIAPLLTLFCYSAIIRYGGNLNIRFGGALFISNGVLHALAETSLGISMYGIIPRLHTHTHTHTHTRARAKNFFTQRRGNAPGTLHIWNGCVLCAVEWMEKNGLCDRGAACVVGI